MTFRNAIQAIFGRLKTYASTVWKEIGTYTARFTPYSGNMYANEDVRACIRTLAEHSSKASVKVMRGIGSGRAEGDKRLQWLVQNRPNLYMNGKDFLYKVRTRLEIDNTAFIYINRDNTGKCIGLYPMPPASLEAIDVGGQLYIRFTFRGGAIMTASWEDLAILRKDYNESDLWGDSNIAIQTSLELLDTTNQGMANAIKATANLRGILKTTKAMISPADAKKQQERFVADYMGMENTSGVAVLDATQDYTPLELKPQLANYKNIEELRNNIYRYFGVNEKIITSQVYGDEWEAFYESCLEGFLLALGLELTNKIFTERERGFGNEVIFESNRMAYMSIKDKLALVAMVDRGAMTPNEWRMSLNMAPIEGGDVPIRRLDTVPTNTNSTGTEGSDDQQRS